MTLINMLNLRIQSHWFIKKNQENKIKNNILLKPKKKIYMKLFCVSKKPNYM